MYSNNKYFSHVYVEKAARNYSRTRAILERIPRSSVIEIDDYQDVFARRRQHFGEQKKSPNLILAVKKDHFLYGSNEYIQGHEVPNFYYNALVLNCLYDCQYCYLQGMYPSANVVVFVNLEEYFEQTTRAIEARPAPEHPLHLAISYDTDLLAFEGMLGYTREWLAYLRSQPDLVLEVRTKSAHRRLFREEPPIPGMIAAWTLSPQPVIERYEWGTASLEQRLGALQSALENGWNVRLCIDPILKIPGWEAVYGQFFNALEGLPWEKLHDVHLGVFRMNQDYLKKIRKWNRTDLLHYPYSHDTKSVSYKEKDRLELINFSATYFISKLSENKIHIWT